jgi:hypothetical protein
VFPPDDNDAIRDPTKRAGPTRRRRAALISLTGAENTRMLDQVAWPGKRAPDGASVHALGQGLNVYPAISTAVYVIDEYQ